MSAEQKLEELPSYSEELGLNLKGPGGRFKWFLASILFGKRISAEIAKRTFAKFESAGITTSEEILEAGWDKLVEILDSGGYTRYDFSTASRLLDISRLLERKYGSLEELYASAENNKDLEKRLLEFKGVGPTTVNIFLRELRPIWKKADPKVSSLALDVAKKIKLEGNCKIKSLESSLVRVNLEYCKSKRCQSCPVVKSCSEFRKYNNRFES
ncbi:hypothetical protein AKJ45_02240 [candidate division MSBL1 archaeon SCGC-AAA261F19]|uniref:HhH-GPD domain-containing protein n=2 Tax=candidate division MSBL1 TaxID=215777 RepID=A0A133V9Q0_9EURY|nr:hypothetical protein AKJ43_01735 [candidate division MSBL1 archaeon SCGC-AAA261D19]KXB03188.1 hypothetical protein AKJ45_02240 [candidate division MSBL1 archaeon SCGC-AAA261F19]